MSSNVAVSRSTPSFTLTKPAFGKIVMIRPHSDYVFEVITVAPSFKSAMSLIFFEYKPIGSIWTAPALTKS